MKKKMLLVFAHPHDGSFAAGGTVAKYADRRWHIELVCATGDKEIAKEGEKAGKVLGIYHVEFLHQPEGLLKSVTPGTLEDLISKKMEEYLPDIVITHDTTGMTHHPDHMKVCYATTYAFQKYARAMEEAKSIIGDRQGRGHVWKEAYRRTFGDIDPANKDTKLYYSCMPTSVVVFLQKVKQIPIESHGVPWRGTADKFVTTVVDITDTKLAKGKALLCHESQKEKVEHFISFDKNPHHNQEWYILRMQGTHEVFMGKNDPVADML